jgi:prepilin-type N-terminal cleavage/methylation domain-containing protein
MNKTKQGFTLIELIVVITVIALITVVTMVSFGGVNRKSRDSRRMADLEKYRIALEIARQVGSTYPNSLDELVTMNLISDITKDPKGADYAYTSTEYTYVLSASVEDPGSTNVPGLYRVMNP